MIVALGWIALAFIGAYAVFCLVYIASVLLTRGGLEALADGSVLGALAAFAWLGFIAYLSPLTIGVVQ